MKDDDVALLLIGGVALAALAQAHRCPSPRSQARGHAEAGVRLLARGRHRKALGEFDCALALDPGCAAAHEGRARSLRALARRRDARRRNARAAPRGALFGLPWPRAVELIVKVATGAAAVAGALVGIFR